MIVLNGNLQMCKCITIRFVSRLSKLVYTIQNLQLHGSFSHYSDFIMKIGTGIAQTVNLLVQKCPKPLPPGLQISFASILCNHSFWYCMAQKLLTRMSRAIFILWWHEQRAWTWIADFTFSSHKYRVHDRWFVIYCSSCDHLITLLWLSKALTFAMESGYIYTHWMKYTIDL